MALKAILPTRSELDALPEAVRGLYVEQDGRFVLPVEGVVPASELAEAKARINEFRQTNKDLMRTLELPPGESVVDFIKTLRAEYKGIDIEEYKALKSEADKLKAKGVKGADDLASIVQKAISDATKPISAKLALIEEERTKLKRDLDDSMLRDAISKAASAKGVKPKALPYVEGKARELFRIVEGKVKPIGDDDLTPDAWMDALAKSDEFLFEPSTGGGANGSAQAGSQAKHAGPFKLSGGAELKTDGITVL